MIDEYFVAESPIGDVYVARSDAGVTCVIPVASAPRFEAHYAERYGRPLRRRMRVPREIARALEDGITGASLLYDLRGQRDFDRRVLEETLHIPRGETRSYGQLALDIGAPRAARAVGTALSHNPVPLLIPCHRVIRAGGVIGEWGSGGSETKKMLLRREGAIK